MRIALLFLCVLGCVMLVPDVASAQTASTESVAQSYIDARTRGDVDALMALFGDSAVVTDRFGAHTGLDTLRGLMRLNIGRGELVSISDLRVDGDRATWVEQIRWGTTVYAQPAEAEIHNGLIYALQFTTGGPRLNNRPVADASDPRAALVQASTVLATLALGLGLVIYGPRALNSADGSRVKGELLVGLRRWSDQRPRGI
ncbi:MAG: nuclear transport factor 2 family protein [Chloroflexi bacterium]|nr:nuclear transport factor 2 family protein [Chloroflexota bacterium]